MAGTDIIIPEVVTTPERAGALTEIIKGLQEEAKKAAEEAKALTITTPESHIAADELRKQYGERSEFAEGVLRPLATAFDKLHKRFTGMISSTSGVFDGAAKTVKAKMIAYDEEQKAIAYKKQIKLEAAEKKRAEEEALEVASLMEDAGLKEEAAAVIAAPLEIAPVAVKKETPKVTGFSYREIWDAEGENLGAMLGGWKEGKVPIQAFQPDNSFLRKQAGALKEAFKGMYPGVKVWSRKV